MGFGESISEFLGGIFVPPGVEDDDELDFDYWSRTNVQVECAHFFCTYSNEQMNFKYCATKYENTDTYYNKDIW